MAARDFLHGRSVLITGAAAGIGRSLADYLIRHHACRLILVDMDGDGLKSILRQVATEAAGRISLHTLDVRDNAAIAALAASPDLANLDVLVNNAGIFYAGDFASMNPDDFAHIMEVNLMGAVRMTHAMLPQLKRSSAPSVINVASLAGLIGGPGMVAYSTSKFGLVGFTEALALELGERFHIAAVCPSFVRTEIAARAVTPAEMGTAASTDARERMDAFLRQAGCDPRKVALAIVDALRTRKAMVLVNPDARILHLTKRLLPGLTGRIVSIAYSQLRKRGVVGHGS